MIATLDELAAALVRSQSTVLRKNSFTLDANLIADLFHFGGGFPANATVPTASGLNGEFPTSASSGAFRFEDPLLGETINIGRVSAMSSVNCMLSIVDRIWHNYIPAFGTSKLNIVWPSTGVQRYADGEGVELYAVIVEALNNGDVAEWAVEFLDQDGTLRTALATYSVTAAAGRMLAFDLPAGVTGIRSVVSFQSSKAQASGAISLVLLKRLVDIPLLANVATSQSGLELGLPTVQPSACLHGMLFMGSSADTGNITGKVDIVQG